MVSVKIFYFYMLQEINQIGVFAICLAAEQITVNVQTYRDRLVHLHKLDWDVLQNQVPVGPFHQVRTLLSRIHVVCNGKCVLYSVWL